MKFYIGVTDSRWFTFLKQRQPEDVNFWQPSGKQNFKAILPNAPFLFKLKSPHNAIAGVGFFVRHTTLPLSIAWDSFGDRNGCESLNDFRRMITAYRKDGQFNPSIGCIVLTEPVFFDKSDWIPQPENWSNSIVQGRRGDAQANSIDAALWKAVEERLLRYRYGQPAVSVVPSVAEMPARYGAATLVKPRLGQGAFRVSILDEYNRKCAITGEKTLPVLQAAHIKPYSENGPHELSNGILLRSDMHTLFDSGYLTVTDQYKIEVSSRIREEFQNGREYYQYHGKSLSSLPSTLDNQPSKDFLQWHNDHVYLR